MLKYIFPNKLVQAIKNDELSQGDQLAFLVLFTIVKGGFSLASSLGCPEVSAIDLMIAFGMVVALIVAFLANGGRAGNGLAMKYVTLGVMLSLWTHALCWLSLFLMSHASYNLLNQAELAQSIHANFRSIHGEMFIVIYLAATWHYFSKFRPASSRHTY